MIITLTLNPAIDETVEVERFSDGDTNRVLSIRRDIGGKGINVARVLKELGYEPLACGFAPGMLGQMIEDTLVDSGIGTEFITFEGETRTNINVIDRSRHSHTVLAASGPNVPPEAVEHLRERLLRSIRPDTWLALAGSIPPPLDPSLHVELIEAVAERGGATALDADGPVVTAILASPARPTLLKINDHELERVIGRPVPDVQAALHAARELQRRGMTNVVVTLGENGAVAVTTSGEFRALPPPVEVRSAVGAGDAFLAGLLLGLKRGRGWQRALELASAAGAAVCVTPGTQLCRAEDVERLLPLSAVVPIEEPVRSPA
jgi:1-phosphofructokinase